MTQGKVDIKKVQSAASAVARAYSEATGEEFAYELMRRQPGGWSGAGGRGRVEGVRIYHVATDQGSMLAIDHWMWKGMAAAACKSVSR